MKAIPRGHTVYRDLQSLEDAQRLRVLADFATATQQSPHPTPYAAEIVDSKSGKRLVRYLNEGSKDEDPTKHAEMGALKAAFKKKKTNCLPGYTLYTTCEPCPMCMGFILWTRLDRVVYGATLDDAGQYGPQIYTYARQMVKSSDLKCEVTGPLERERCLELFRLPFRRSV